jgi:predicted MFS family arabinose efflux permease
VALLPRENALLFSGATAASIVGPMIFGVVVATIGPGWGLAIDSASFLISAVLLLQLADVVTPARRSSASFRADLSEGWRVISSRRWLRWGLAFWSVYFFASAFFGALGPVVSRDTLGGVGAWSTLIAAFGVGGLIGSVAALRRAPANSLRATFSASGATAAASLIVLAIPAPVAAIAVAQVLGGSGRAYASIRWETALQTSIEPQMLSRVSSYDWLTVVCWQAAGFAVAGPISEAAGLRTTLFAAASLLVLSAGGATGSQALAHFARLAATALRSRR